MTTCDPWFTGVRGASVPWWVLLQHPVGHQTTRHKSRCGFAFNPLQAPGYPLLSSPGMNKDEGFLPKQVIFDQTRHTCSSAVLWIFLLQSISLNQTLQNQRKWSRFILRNANKNMFLQLDFTNLLGEQPEVYHLCQRHS